MISLLSERSPQKLLVLLLEISGQEVLTDLNKIALPQKNPNGVRGLTIMKYQTHNPTLLLLEIKQ